MVGKFFHIKNCIFVYAPDVIFYSHSISFIILIFVPTIIALFFIVKSCINNKENTTLLCLSLLVILTLACAAIAGKIVFITKYSIEIYPILILLLAHGFSLINNRIFKIIIISIFSITNLFYLLLSPNSAPRIPRDQGHKIVAQLLENANAKEGDTILFEYYPSDRFSKYINLAQYNVQSIHKGNFYRYLAKNTKYSDIYNNGKAIYKPIFSREKNPRLDYFLKQITNKIEQNQNLFLIINNGVAIYPYETIQEIAANEKLYEDVPLLYLVFSYINNYTINYFSTRLKVTRVERIGDWTIIRLTKINI